MAFTKILSIINCFLHLKITIINNWASIITEHQISILEWFLKDHETLNTEVMAAENSALSLQEKIECCIEFKYSQTKNYSDTRYNFLLVGAGHYCSFVLVRIAK